MWTTASRDEQQRAVDMIDSVRERKSKRKLEPRRVHCPGDFPREHLSAQMAADILYQLEHKDEPGMGYEELAREELPAAQPQGRLRRLLA